MTQRPYGIIAVFDTPEAILAAARHLRELGYRAIEAYTPFPVEGLDEALQTGRKILLPLVILAAAVVGLCCGANGLGLNVRTTTPDRSTA